MVFYVKDLETLPRDFDTFGLITSYSNQLTLSIFVGVNNQALMTNSLTRRILTMNSPREAVKMKTRESLVKKKTLALMVRKQINSMRRTRIGSVVNCLDKTLPKILRGKNHYLMRIT